MESRDAAPLQAESAKRGEAEGDTKIHVSELNAWFGKQQVLNKVNMDVPSEQVTAVIGPSGCGKSTFIRCINRMHELVPSARMEGTIRLDGEEIYNTRVDPVLLRRRVGMVFQKPNPFPSMSIRENVLSGLKLTKRLVRKDSEAITERALRQAALWDEVKDKLSAPGTSLSGGQQQRLCIARTLAVEPEVILMDEPCSALDPIATARIEDLLHELRNHYTILIVTHNLQQATRVSDRTAFFLSGELVEYTTTDKLFTSPADRRTEDYITGKFG
ncbi:phosphate ABC transporter ATP-binding protein PstB [Haliangium ochraceum]|uniref:Phosphate ABC transporter, ATPase subunit n=1 Tax=Haliangium ochraceum (strain DSM 14365 / JCM 11303 / SMP-2) TaxID=502025 RepID=D0LQ33_HALO1|nr:phosphate ABC transporter ATP-binding protein PstB [Haliangium ochraceum]ACY17070.1 phosphate ABC transporter, ATPase subunit [Haliangium ochraceum DSM 14365]